jgi:hypothetical protein
VASAATEVVVTWKDRIGKVARIVFYVAATIVNPDDPVIKGLIALIEKIIRAKATQIEVHNAQAFNGSAGSQAYSTCEDKAQLALLDADGKSHNWKVPGLKGSILDTDGETVKPSAAAVATWITDVSTFVEGPGGVAVTTAFEGHRLMRKRLKH